MNAPLSLNKNQAETSLLLAANETLELLYLTRPEPCIALLISRNYHLLTQQSSAPELRFTWVKDAKYWWQTYLRQSTGKYVDFSFLIRGEPVFKPIHF
jgi:hypothetical protein